MFCDGRVIVASALGHETDSRVHCFFIYESKKNQRNILKGCTPLNYVVPPI